MTIYTELAAKMFNRRESKLTKSQVRFARSFMLLQAFGCGADKARKLLAERKP